jgi:hypothetical protein
MLIAVLLASAVSMLWLFWHHPVTTAIATAVILGALGICAALARLSDTEGGPVLDQSESINFQ